MFRFMQNWRLMSCTKARLLRLLNIIIMQTLLANLSWYTKITGNANTLYARSHFVIWILYLPHLFLNLCFTQYHDLFSCSDAYDCTPDPAMVGFAIRLYEITIEGSDAAGNVGRDQCRVIIIPSNMTIQDADAIVQKCKIPSCNNYWLRNHVGNQNKHSFGVYVWPGPSTN